MDDKKFRLNSASSQIAINEDIFDKINIESKTNPIPVGETNKVLNLGEQFNQERQDSKLYRLTGTFNPLFTNVLFNTTGPNSWTTFNSATFRDGTFPPAATLSLNDDEDLTYREAIAKYLKEENGWFGYYNPDPSQLTLCNWVDMEPRRELFSMAPRSGVKNWEVTITYPAELGGRIGDFNHPIVKDGGLLLIDVSVSVIGNRNMLTFATPVKHNLSQGDSVKLKGLRLSGNNGALSPYNGEYSVIRLGKDNGDDMNYYFSVDIGELISIDTDSRITRLVNGNASEYYFRVFKKINTKVGVIENDDYEIYPLAFGQTIYEDKSYQFVFNEDIDISNLIDNRGRPLSEIYITIIKTDSGNVFTPVKSGVKMPYFPDNDGGVSDINRVTNKVTSHEPLPDSEGGVTIDDENFYGDVVEYNILESKETILGDVYHRFNSLYRENDASVSGQSLGVRYEGYTYKPHHKIKIREYSNYIEQGTFNTLDRPTYSDTIGDGRYFWRDLLDIGLNDTQETFLDYPFLNGCHYINNYITLPLFRQDPFGFYNLRWDGFSADKQGILMDDKLIFKTSQDVC
tara:strand:+ start:46450 stop:48162 length:1713 start_codon:yes stop_codon:yes gene_type:complete